MEKVERLEKLAKEKGITLSQFSLAWLLKRSKSLIPILGVRTEEQFTDNLDALMLDFSDEELNEIDQITPSPFKDFSR